MMEVSAGRGSRSAGKTGVPLGEAIRNPEHPQLVLVGKVVNVKIALLHEGLQLHPVNSASDQAVAAEHSSRSYASSLNVIYFERLGGCVMACSAVEWVGASQITPPSSFSI